MVNNSFDGFKNVVMTSQNLDTIQGFLRGCSVVESTGNDARNSSSDLVSRDVEVVLSNIKAMVVIPMCSFIGVPTNFMNIVVFIKYGLNFRTNVCLFMLSLVDLLYEIDVFVMYMEQMWSHSLYEPQTLEPISNLLVTHHLLGLFGLGFASMFVSAVIAVERCLCIVFPLRFQTLLKVSSTWAVLSFGVLVITAGNFAVSEKYRFVCVYDKMTMTMRLLPAPSEYYLINKYLVDMLDGFVYGVVLHVATVATVSIATSVTVFALRETLVWRQKSVSSKSGKERALTKTLIYLSIQFVLFNLPNMVFKIAGVFVPDLNHYGHYKNVYFILLFVIEVNAIINSCFPFFVYFCSWTKYRESVLGFFGNFKTKDMSRSVQRFGNAFTVQVKDE